MKIGLAQMDVVWEKKEENILKAEKIIGEAAKAKIDYLLFPEMSFTGFSMNTAFIGESKLELKTIGILSDFAKKNQIWLGFGYVEKGFDKALNRFAIINRLGQVVADYAKIHPFSYGEESNYYTGGKEIEFCVVEEFTTTPFICYDLRFPEIFQIASKHSQLITVAANWPIERREHWLTLLRARAIENQCYIAGVNRVGCGNDILYGGDSIIVNPYGEIISFNIEEGLISAEIDKEIVLKYRESFHLKKDRREELYQNLGRLPC
ncbi:putative amidohydrolase [Lachnotalea glycerini]|uniref:Carbon-nitrogen family hydrolase n=1 Tax=Lachnotalea glycerini TaxID=1763509 RepID=A0A255I514_9FIRM|nr:carbon-nitrogen family hydrolase [Lachnotalea glycerini]PXV95397.1 putative amidohydrolase [Lachnotalea glycerini]RDY32720.1 carbon-nitrogen family hydrolase [Lachnotalea glycerini]